VSYIVQTHGGPQSVVIINEPGPLLTAPPAQGPRGQGVQAVGHPRGPAPDPEDRWVHPGDCRAFLKSLHSGMRAFHLNSTKKEAVYRIDLLEVPRRGPMLQIDWKTKIMILKIKCARCDSHMGTKDSKKWGQLCHLTYSICPSCQKVLSPEGAEKIVDAQTLHTMALQASNSTHQ
jgi:hypothetical protein